MVAAIAFTHFGCPAHMPKPADALDDPRAILARAADRLKAVQTMSVYARVWQGDILVTAPVRMDLIARRPNQLYLAVLDPTQNLLGAMATDGKMFTSFRRGQKDCLTGPACAENVRRFIPLSLEAADLVGVLMGDPPAIRGITAQTVRWDPRAGAYCVVNRATDGTVQETWITHGQWVTTRSKITDPAGKLLVDLRYDDVKKVGSKKVAHRIDVVVPASKVRSLRIVFREVELDDETLDPDAFMLTCPEGSTPQHLPCSANTPNEKPVEQRTPR